MAALSVDQFFALARSSPWRWSTLRFTVTWHERMYAPAPGYEREPVRAWVARPDGLRVESLDGSLLMAARQPELPGSMGVLLSADGPRHGTPAVLPATGEPPIGELEFDEHGLVGRRPVHGMRDDPMYVDYHWVAMLDPRELADGVLDLPDVPPIVVEDLSEVDHYGRPAWEAVVRPTETYDPRCSCCALLFGARSEAIRVSEGEPPAAEPSLGYADAYRVRIDTQTSVCVLTSEIGGAAPGSGHELVIEAVDEPMSNELFLHPRQARRMWRRTR